MNKEIKFRAWVRTYDGFEMIDDYCFLEPKENHFHGTDLTNERPDIIEVLAIMPFVRYYGVISLFEGDICKLSAEECLDNNHLNLDYDWEITMKLVYDTDYCAFWFVDESGNVITFGDLSDVDANIEILGNICHNSELVAAQ